jgi:hypothetical protein
MGGCQVDNQRCRGTLRVLLPAARGSLRVGGVSLCNSSSPMAKVTVAVFMDWQNVYRAAREAFELHQAPPERGNFNPLEVARYLAAGNKRGKDGKLTRIEIHRGLPDSTTNPKGHGAGAGDSFQLTTR